MIDKKKILLSIILLILCLCCLFWQPEEVAEGAIYVTEQADVYVHHNSEWVEISH
jgi:hypothetical protein